jgi:hypothetical protein
MCDSDVDDWDGSGMASVSSMSIVGDAGGNSNSNSNSNGKKNINRGRWNKEEVSERSRRPRKIVIRAEGYSGMQMLFPGTARGGIHQIETSCEGAFRHMSQKVVYEVKCWLNISKA